MEMKDMKEPEPSSDLYGKENQMGPADSLVNIAEVEKLPGDATGGMPSSVGCMGIHQSEDHVSDQMLLNAEEKPQEKCDSSVLELSSVQTSFMVPPVQLHQYVSSNDLHPSDTLQGAPLSAPFPSFPQASSSAFAQQMPRDHNFPPPLNSAYIGSSPAYQTPFPHQPSPFAVPLSSSWNSLPPRPSQAQAPLTQFVNDSSGNAAGVQHSVPRVHFQPNLVVPRNDFYASTSPDIPQVGERHAFVQTQPVYSRGSPNRPPAFLGDSLALGEHPGPSSKSYPYMQQPHSGPQTASISRHLVEPGVSSSVSRYTSDLLDQNQAHRLPDFGGSRFSSHFNPYATTFDQPLTMKFSSDPLIHGRDMLPSSKYSAISLSNMPIDGHPAESLGSRNITPPSAHTAEGKFSQPGGNQYDPLYDSIEPSTNLLKKSDPGSKLEVTDNLLKKSDPGPKLEVTDDSGVMLRVSGSNEPLDVEVTKGQKADGAIAFTISAEKDEFDETAEAEVGVVENRSPSDSNDEEDVPTGEIEIEQVKPSGEKNKSKESRSMRLFKISVNGRFVVVCGDGEYIIYTALAWRNRSFGSALEFVWSSDGEYAVRESTSRIKIFSKNFQEKKSIRPTFSAERIYGGTLLAMCSNEFICFYDWADCRLIRRIDVSVKNLYWADSGDLVAIASDTSFYILKYNRDVVSAHLDSGRSVDEQGVEEAFELLYEINERVRTGIWVGDCFIYNNSSWRLNYCVGGEVTTMFHLDRPMYLLGYLANQSRVFLIDKEFNVIGYTLLLSLVEYKTLVMRGDWDRANEVLPSIPKEHHNSVAHFLESRGMVEEALEVATEPDYRFDLAIQLGKLEIAKDIAVVAQSESKWKQLGELAMSDGMLEMAEECLKYANDLSGLLLLYSSLGDAEGITELATLAKEQGKNNVTFLCMFLLGKMEECIQLLVDSNRVPEAAFMARSYLPSKVSEIVAIWKKDLSKVNQKAAEALADPEEYPNMFEHWQVACAVESKVAEERGGGYPPATEYVNHADRSTNNLVEAFSNMKMDEESLENGDIDHDVSEQSGDEVQELGQDDEQNEGQEEPVVVDADSTDSAVLINETEAEEEWGTNTEGKPSA